jgi:transposase-like protein
MAKSILIQPYFSDETAALAKLESIVWPNGPTCPKCGAVDRIGALEGVKDKKGRVRPGLKKCYHCRAQFTVRVGTVFEASHIPLHLWLQAAFLMCSSKKGISSNQLHRTLGITLKSAWFMSHRLREAMRDDVLPPLGGPWEIVEADETYIGRNSKPRVNKRGGEHKNKVMGLVQRGGKARTVHVDRVTSASVKDVLTKHIDSISRLMTDEAKWYRKAGLNFVTHQTVHHRSEEYVRGEAHTNTIEGYFSIFKRGMKGIYQHCGERHLHRYLAEFDFRYNNRVALGVNDPQRTETALKGIVGKRLTYRQSSGQGRE